MYHFELAFKVRDYECDLQGVVNNSVYLNYMEHTRHEFIKTLGLNFAELHSKGIDPMVIRTEIDYKYPLKSGDTFLVKIRFEKEGNLKLVFFQDIFHENDNKLIAKAKILAVCIQNGKPTALPKAMEILNTLH